MLGYLNVALQTAISLKTRQVFREYLTTWTLREISDAFDAQNLGCDLEYRPSVSGQRRVLIEQYYHAVDWSDASHVAKILNVFAQVLEGAVEKEKLHGLSNGYEVQADAERLAIMRMKDALKRDGLEIVSGRILPNTGFPSLENIRQAADIFDIQYMRDQIRRMELSVESDPALAIGTAKELIETCCKTILGERGKSVTGTLDIPTLTRETLKELQLVPDGIPDAARGSDVIKRLLNNLGTIGNGLAELRGLYGTGHGRHGRTTGLRPRHAKLAVGTASTLVTFLFETHSEAKQ